MGDFPILPESVTQYVKELGRRIRLARTRRKLSIVELAAKAGIDRNTLGALELGKPGVSISAYVMTLWALGLEHTLDAVADPNTDSHGKTLEASRRSKRVRKPRVAKKEYDF
ncbi:MAG: helix-turn-helix domain-containing protein [Burkholderiales bacterium]|nr:helix-turn-helix domain-containing protein [Burkholderiales bacterium]